MVGSAELAKARRAHELEKAQASFSIRGALKILIAFRQDLMSGVSDSAVTLDIGIYQPVKLGRVALELFQVAVGFIAGKGRGNHERRVAKEIIPHIRLIDYFIFCAVKNLPDQPLI